MTEYEKEEFEELKYIVNRLYCAIDDLKDKVDRLSLTKEQYVEYLQQKELIEKLQKENEELKNKVIIRDKELIRLEEYANKNFERKDDVKANYISKNKIRNFIEKHKDNFYDGTANGCDYIDYEVIKEFIEEE